MVADEIRARISAEVDAWTARLIAASHDIHAHPELNFDEHHAHAVLTGLLGDAGLAVEPHAYDLATAFAARAGTEGPCVAVLCEYDALPGIGHACGHNVIAAAGAGAGIAAASVAQALGGRVVVLGCPAEEGGGGKIDLIERGAFDDVVAALMVHPADADLTRMDVIAVAQYEATYTGVAAHAAAAPEKGRNALDAAVLGYVNVAALRQHIDPRERIHGIFTEAGTAANVVPRRAVAHWMVRSPSLAGLESLVSRVHAALRAGAAAAGCEVDIVERNRTYADLRESAALLERYAAHAATLGRPLAEPGTAGRVVGSTDMGNVSYVVPSIHPTLKVAPAGVAIHTEDFAEAAVSPEADAAIADAATALALTIAELWTDEALRSQLSQGFADRGREIPGATPPSP